MREILFRGKRTDGKGWIEGFYFQKPNISSTDGLPIYHGISDLPPFGAEVIPETVGQYTGLTDKNGKKIFEGDVIRAHYANVPPERSEHVETVIFRNGRFCGMYANGTMKTWAGLPDGVQHLPGDRSVWMDSCEVIGNIYDNPELLNGGD